ncbi:hypothetical protein ACFQ88_23335 [Paenibacillus sp. NPDC056579]|uniref:hypothetical protein n=1 Tax=Paenibacillus sp. NPDC056579 TaxID=3345871 RepID=UPI0036943F86
MFTIDLTLTKPINDISVQPYLEPKYDEELEDGRAVIVDICRIIAKTNAVIFNVSGFGQEEWPVDCIVDLPLVIEQLPEILININQDCFEFEIDFYEQGVERTIEFSELNNHKGKVQLLCKSRTDWLPNPEILEIDREIIREQIKKLHEVFLELGMRLCPNLIKNPLFIEWMKG